MNPANSGDECSRRAKIALRIRWPFLRILCDIELNEAGPEILAPMDRNNTHGWQVELPRSASHVGSGVTQLLLE
jgi:hypothetical protein